MARRATYNGVLHKTSSYDRPAPGRGSPAAGVRDNFNYDLMHNTGRKLATGRVSRENADNNTLAL